MPKRTLPDEAFSNTQPAVCKRFKARWLSLPAEIQAAIHYMARPPHPTAQLMKQAFSNATNNWHINGYSRTTKKEGLELYIEHQLLCEPLEDRIQLFRVVQAKNPHPLADIFEQAFFSINYYTVAERNCQWRPCGAYTECSACGSRYREEEVALRWEMNLKTGAVAKVLSRKIAPCLNCLHRNSLYGWF